VGHVPPGAAASKSLEGGHVPPSAERLSLHCHYNYRQAGLPLSRQAPRALVFSKLQTPPGTSLLTARRHRDPEPPVSTLSLGE